MVIVGFIVINQFVVWFLRVDDLCKGLLTINWTVFDDAFEQHYSQDNGSPSKPIRLMVGLLLLKQLENLSDERVVLQFKRSPYYQYFCGYSNYMPGMPCNATELVHFRKRIGRVCHCLESNVAQRHHQRLSN
jgi:IS5 family transposase